MALVNSFDIPTTLTRESGPNWGGQFSSGVLPLLRQATSSLPAQVQKLPGVLQGMYGNLMRRGMGPQGFQGTLNQLASRGMLNSSVASDALSKAATGIAENIGNQAYPSYLAGLREQIELPSTLSRLAQLEQSSSDPMRAYELLARMLMY